MHKFLAISEIKTRAEAIGSNLSQLAADAGLAHSTVWRLSNGKTRYGWTTTNQKLVDALIAREQRQREHLATLPAIEREDAA
jgi:hypothetical protein